MYFVDLVVESLVSCMVIIDRGIWEYVTRSCRHDIAVLSEEAFHVMMCDFWLVRDVGCCSGVCILSIGGVGYLYYVIGSFYLSASMRSWFTRNENVFCMFWILGGSGLRCMWSYSYLWIVFEGEILS